MLTDQKPTINSAVPIPSGDDACSPTPEATAPPPPPDPILPPGITKALADKVLSFYLADDTPTAEIADLLSLPLRTIGLILETDYAREVCALLERLDQRRSEILAGTHRIRALSATAQLASTAKREETRRLAAASLLRLVPYTPRASVATSPATGGGGSSSAARTGGGVSAPTRATGDGDGNANSARTGGRASPSSRLERAFIDSIATALNQSIQAESNELKQRESELEQEFKSLRSSVANLPKQAASPATRGGGGGGPVAAQQQPGGGVSPSAAQQRRVDSPPGARPPQPPHPTLPPLLDQLAARMAAPPSPAPQRPHDRRSRDAPKAA